ncbi:MAG: glycosyl transferase family 1 [Candidatus Kerfeldbacteria bacterium CG_4_10_14_0_8_um_filter_42_10]|uniref:Glycosyl transferase family 1 n=1 Tax=Candidatus Kerfeldbacteria bacterium CG_4_10_14_0_8_um_filter_42_10 TaxID=2014248 RepID=A0A2M7RFA4_9BACT|nr:MAG: glycosyl transferase family 1 [Candidatus Kerfeldbacteria bacterium CG_4_10_14_0_8_um_filter_42_10]
MNNKLKIAYIGQKGIENVVGGVETHVRELAIRSAQAGFDTTVYVRPYTQKEKEKYVEGVRARKLLSLRTKHFDAITHVFLSTWHAIFSKADIIHYHGVGPSLLSFLPRIFRPSAITVVTFHSIDRQHTKWNAVARFFLRMGEWTACRFPHITIAVSKNIAEYCEKHYRKKPIVIPNGITDPIYREADSIKQKFGLEKEKYLLVLSRLVQHKNIHLIIEAFKNINAEVKLAIVGGGAFTDNYVRSLKELAHSDRRIVFTGECRGKVLQELISNSLFYVNASNSEGCPTTALEVMSYGKMVLMSDLKVNQEVVGNLGRYFRHEDPSDLKGAMEWLIAHKEKIYEKQKNLSGYALGNYHWDTLAPAVFNVYRNFYRNGLALASAYQLKD